MAFQKKNYLATVSTTAIDDDFEAYVAGSAELESSYAESEAEGDMCEESAAQGFELLQSLSFDYESDSEPSKDQKDKVRFFVIFLSNSQYLLPDDFKNFTMQDNFEFLFSKDKMLMYFTFRIQLNKVHFFQFLLQKLQHKHILESKSPQLRLS